MANTGGAMAWTQKTVWPFEEGMLRRALYERRDQSGLPRHRFYARHFQPEAQEHGWMWTGGTGQAGASKGPTP